MREGDNYEQMSPPRPGSSTTCPGWSGNVVIMCSRALRYSLSAELLPLSLCRRPIDRPRHCWCSPGPSNLAGRFTDNGAVEQRIARIREQVLSRGDLIQLIEQNDLYSDERRSQPLSKIIDKMRQATRSARSSVTSDSSRASQNNTVAIA